MRVSTSTVRVVERVLSPAAYDRPQLALALAIVKHLACMNERLFLPSAA
jgi:hypothetical protein